MFIADRAAGLDWSNGFDDFDAADWEGYLSGPDDDEILLAADRAADLEWGDDFDDFQAVDAEDYLDGPDDDETGLFLDGLLDEDDA